MKKGRKRITDDEDQFKLEGGLRRLEDQFSPVSSKNDECDPYLGMKAEKFKK